MKLVKITPFLGKKSRTKHEYYNPQFLVYVYIEKRLEGIPKGVCMCVRVCVGVHGLDVTMCAHASAWMGAGGESAPL